MKTKKRITKGFLLLISILLTGLFFARTVQTITTAKVQKISATRGKLEDRIELEGEVLFSHSEPVTVSDAGKLKQTVTKLMARPGYLIKPGDTLYTAATPDFEEKLEPLKTKYEEEVRKRAEKVAGGVRIRQTSEHNDYYNAMIKATDDYWNKLYAARAAALRAGKELPGDMDGWGMEDWPEEDMPAAAPGEEDSEDRMKAAMREAYRAKLARDEATDMLKRIYTGQGSPAPKVSEGVFDYIREIDGMSENILSYLDQMLALERMRMALEEVKAEREGWLTAFPLEEGKPYDGSAPAYYLSAPGEMPVIRCDISDIKKTISEGMKARVNEENRELTISAVQVEADGRMFALIELDEAALSALGGLNKLMSGTVRVQVIYKAQRTTTLLPASALRSDGSGQYYVYAISQTSDGLFGNAAYTVNRREVTVIETSSKLAALEDDLSGIQIADGEDRALRDGLAVMEYVR